MTFTRARISTWRALLPAYLVFVLSVATPSLVLALEFGVLTSGFAARPGNVEPVFWVDDQQVLFVGQGIEDSAKADATTDSHGLYVWNVRTGVVRQHDPVSHNVRSLCLAGQYARYVFDREKVAYVSHGRLFFGREKRLDVQALRDGILSVSPLSCREFNPRQLQQRYGTNAIPLRAPGEYLDRTRQDVLNPQPLRYFPADGGSPVTLSRVPTLQVIATPRFSTHTGRYVFNQLRTRQAPDEPQRVWTLDQGGNTKEVTLPSGAWLGGYVIAMPARKGWIMTSTAIDVRGGSFGSAGAYLVSGQTSTKILSGLPEAFEVSPDGCKVALAIISKKLTEGALPEIKAMDICPKGG